MPSQSNSRLANPNEHTTFVNGSRPTAPIKTAIIRPTNFYDGTRRASFGSSPDSKPRVKTDCYILHQTCGAGIYCEPAMPPLSPEADNDPLSDNCAVMYGTNATRRRRSKVEAWIENSSSAHSEDSSPSEEMRPLGRRRNMVVSSSSSTLSKEEVDLSFENLCQELLALSASCTTLERMITQTDSQLNTAKSSKHEDDGKSEKNTGRLERKESFADKVVSDIQRKFSTDEICSNMSTGGFQSKRSSLADKVGYSISADSQLTSSNESTEAKQTSSSQLVSGAMNNSKHYENSWPAVIQDTVSVSQPPQSSVIMRQKSRQPNASTFIFGTVEDQSKLSECSFSSIQINRHRDGINISAGEQLRDQRMEKYPRGDHLEQMQTAVYHQPKVTAGKLEALTVDVGAHVQGYRSVVQVPVRDSLVTITSPQAVNRRRSQQGRDNFYGKEHQPDAAPALVRNSRQEGAFSEESPPPLPARNYNMKLERIPKIEITECRPAAVETPVQPNAAQVTDKQTDHVAAAIITQCVTEKPAKLLPPNAAQKFHRSMSEPASFATPTPDRRSSLIRSPSKRELKSRLKVGMDFIRHTSSNTTKEDHSTSNGEAVCKDNILMNNLDSRCQSKSSMVNPDKMTLPVQLNGEVPKMTAINGGVTIKPSIGSDSVFDDSSPVENHRYPMPAFTSTVKQVDTHPSTSASVARSSSTLSKNGRRTQHESLSSSFESEALDILASLKSANALKAHLRHNNKFPTDVDPVTGSPRNASKSLSDDRLRLAEDRGGHTSAGGRVHHQSYPGSNKSSCLSSPTSGSPPCLLQVQHRSPHSGTPSSRRSRQSYYDNVLQSPYGGLRISVASGSSTGTVFSRPWGDLPRWEEFFPHNDDFRHRLGSTVSSQGRNEHSVDNPSASPLRNYIAAHQHQTHQSTPLHQHQHHSSSRVHPQHSHSKETHHSGGSSVGSRSPAARSHHLAADPYLKSIPRFPISTIPDVALEANRDLDHSRSRTNWEVAIDRALNRVRTFTKLLLTAERNTCEITRYTQILLSDNRSLPGSLVGRFHTCTWETNSLDRQFFANSRKQSANSKNNNISSHSQHNPIPKTDWYSNNIRNNWMTECNGKSGSQKPTAYSNAGYLLNTYSRETSRSSDAGMSSFGAKEHIVLSNVRQFVDGMKRYLLNQPDTQLMFAIQRERIKLGSDELINLDAIMEAVLQKVILQPLSDHLLNVITTHTDYCIREITQIESGMKVILNNRNELFANLDSMIREIEVHENTLRSAFQSMKTEFSPMSKLQYLLQMALLFVLIRNKFSAAKEQDLILLFIYTMARYGDATLLVHLAYVRHLIPHSIRSGAVCYILSLYETCVQVYNRIVKVPGTLARRSMILNEILEKLSCHLMIADESSNRVIRKKMVLSRWSTAAELIDIIHIDMANYELNNYKLYLATDEKEEMLRGSDNVSELLMSHMGADNSCALVYRRPNTQMLLPPP